MRLLAPISKNRLERNLSLDIIFFDLTIWNYFETSARNLDLEKQGF